MSGRIVVITGASGGIGAALARLLGRRGERLVLTARRPAELEMVARESGPDATPIVADLTRREDADRVAREALARFGRIDVWVNNVGRGITRVPSELTGEDLDVMIEVNVKSALYGTQAVLPHFKARGEGQVVNVSSMLGRVPSNPMRAAYTGAKHFLTALTEDFRNEVQRSYPGIQFSLISPGMVHTDFGLNALHGGPDSRRFPDAQSPEEVAEVIAEVLESRRADVYTKPGSRNKVIGHLEALGVDP